MGDAAAVRVRQATLADLPAVYRVCLLTGDQDWPGDDPLRDPDLLGHVYAGPYVVHLPDLTRVVVDDQGVAGYVLGCADTHELEAWWAEHWFPALRAQHPLGSGRPRDQGLVRLLHAPPATPAEVVERYPAHLHIDLLPRVQGRGLGRRLIEWLCAELAGRGVPGVHLGVGLTNTHAIEFYTHLGFEPEQVRQGTLAMVKDLVAD